MHVLLHGPIESVESEDAHFILDGTITSSLEEEVSKFWYVFTEDRDLLYRG